MASWATLSCGSAPARRRGDRAFLQQDWDSAVANYQQAMRKARTPEEVECIRPRLDGSCTRSG